MPGRRAARPVLRRLPALEREQLALRIPDGLQAGPGITRAELERQANRWQLGLQDARTGRLPCDGDGACHSRLCAGWDEFYEGELAGFYREMCGEEVRVVPDELFEPAPFRPLRPGPEKRVPKSKS